MIDNGVFVSLNPVPSINNDPWTGANDTPLAPYEAQFLKVYDVTPPPGAASAPATQDNLTYSATGELVMTWDTDFGPHDNVAANEVVIRDDENNVIFEGVLEGANAFVWEVPSEHYGKTVTVQVTPVSVAGISAETASSVSSTVVLLDPDGDEDNNGVSNFAEYIAGTDPFDAESVLRAENIAVTGSVSAVSLQGVAGRRYRLEYSEDFLAGAPEPTWLDASGWVEVNENGLVVLEDLEEDPPSRIYRIVVQRTEI